MPRRFSAVLIIPTPRSNRQTFAHARVVRRRSRRTSTDDEDNTLLPMVVDCSDSLVDILHNFHCEHCCLSCFLALVLDCDNNSCKDSYQEYRCRHVYEALEKGVNKITRG